MKRPEKMKRVDGESSHEIAKRLGFNKSFNQWEKYHKFRADDLWQGILSLPTEEEIYKLLRCHSERVTGYKIAQRPMRDLAKAIFKRIRE